jgi:hypothetical protein
MAVPIHATEEPSIYIDGTDVVIGNLRSGDSELLALVGAASDPAQLVSTCLSVGARLVRLGETTAETAVVEQRFADLEHRVEQGVEKAVGLIAETASRYLDPEKGALKAMLDELGQALDDAFDPESKASVLAKFEGLLTGGTADLKKVVRDLVDPGNPESPLGRLRLEVTGEMKELRRAVNELRTQVAVEQTEADVLELTAIKGRRFEEIAFEATAGFVSLYGDEAEAVGDTNGNEANRCGDIIVKLNEADTPATAARVVVEAKDRKLSMRETFNELERAMKDRDAKAGVMVFSSQAKGPISTPLQVFGSKVIVVLDKDEIDDRALRLGLAAARCAVQRQLNGSAGKDVDLDGALALVEEGQRTLASHSTIKRCHTTAQRQIANAVGEVEGLVEQLDEILRRIAVKLGR